MNPPVIRILSIFSGAAYAFLLYSKKSSWSPQNNIFIAIIRVICISILVYMILSPFVKSNTVYKEKASIVIAIDNSTSVNDAIAKQKKPLIDFLNKMKSDLEDEFDLKVFTLNGSTENNISKIVFDRKETNIVEMLDNVSNNLEGNKVKALVLLSDGIVNKGNSPLYKSFNFPVYALGVGDTLSPKDVILKNCLYNNIVGKDNRFPINVEIKADGYKGRTIEVSVNSGKSKLMSKSIAVNNNNFSSVISFESSEKEAGLKHYTIAAQPFDDEFTAKNNYKEIYFDVIEAKQKIAIVTTAPHPDVKALASSLNGNENTETQIFINDLQAFNSDKFDLVILYQVPHVSDNFNGIAERLRKNNVPTLFIIGNNSNIGELNAYVPNFKLLTQPWQTDKVSAILNPAFTRAGFKDETNTTFGKNAPLIVPFGEYNLGSGWEVVLFQKVGNVVTSKPLLSVYSAEGKSMGILFGEGIWQWRLNEFSDTQSAVVFDDFFKKIITLLTQKADKRKFRFSTQEREFDENAPILFKVETYNDIYESTYGNEINIQFKSENAKAYNYNFNNTESNPNFEVRGLPAGIYKYIAKTILSGKEHMVKGEFIVQNVDLENFTHVADFELLRNFAAQTGGAFFDYKQKEELLNQLNAIAPEQKVFKTEQITEVINWYVILFLILGLLTFEWSVRKYLGQV